MRNHGRSVTSFYEELGEVVGRGSVQRIVRRIHAADTIACGALRVGPGGFRPHAVRASVRGTIVVRAGIAERRSEQYQVAYDDLRCRHRHAVLLE